MPSSADSPDDTPHPSRAAFESVSTEASRPGRQEYETLSTRELVDLMNAEDATVPEAVGGAREAIAWAVDAISDRLARGGRLIYVGAGTSGRIAAADAAECETTFSTDPGTVLALVAGGAAATPLEQAEAEDDHAAGDEDMTALEPGPSDVVVAVSASGGTPYVLGGTAAAARSGALTVCVVSAADSELAGISDRVIAVPVGPEFVAGSTRLKAGTAQKLVLNMLSTLAMIRLGKTFGTLMVDVVPSNEKLRGRIRRIVGEATSARPDEVDSALAAADGNARVAIVSLLAGVGADEARLRLERSGQSIRGALDA
jgi:N-acetylmuramic acid 6-phosphate etherase